MLSIFLFVIICSAGEYSSDNNVHRNGYDSEGPEDTVYEYDYNDIIAC